MLFPGAAEIAEMFSYFQAHTYLGSDSSDRIALANKIAGRQPTNVFDVGSSEFPGSTERPVNSTLIENERKSILTGADKLSLRGCS